VKSVKPEGAKFGLKQISALYAWAIRNDLATANPSEKVEKLGGGSDGYYTWTD
jgi:integrase